MANKATTWLFGRAAQLVVSGVLAVGTGIWQKASKASTWPELVAISLVVFVCLCWAADNFWHFPLRWRVREWLDQSGDSVRTGASSPNNQFNFILTAESGVVLTILQFDKDGPITIAAFGNKPTADQLAVFNAWPPQKKAAFWKAARMELLRFGIEFSNLTLEGEGITLSTRLQATHKLTNLDFSSALIRVQCAVRLYREHMDGLVNEPDDVPDVPNVV